MAFNPFLSMGEPAAQITAEALNPFMMTDEPLAEITGDNPFAASNPFADFAGYEPAAGDTVPHDIFGAAEPQGGGAKHFDGFSTEPPPDLDVFGLAADAERRCKPTELDLGHTTTDFSFASDEAPPSRPLPPETQNLILTVTGHMEFASGALLDRIPPTRTPSPVSVRDIHSPSLTPEPELEPLPLDEPAPPLADSFDINRNKPAPARPPPARPPPAARPPPPAVRPPPPRPAPPPVAQPPQENRIVDDINLFDAPAPVTVKPTKEAILSLYSAPQKEEKQIDFLSDDFLDDISVGDGGEVPSTTATEMVLEEAATTPGVPGAPQTIVSANVAPMDYSEVQSEESIAPTNTSPFTGATSDDLDTGEPKDAEMNPFETESFVDTVSPFPTAGTNIFGNADNYNIGVTSETNFEPMKLFNVTGAETFSGVPTREFCEERSDPFTGGARDASGAGSSDAFDDATRPTPESQASAAGGGWAAAPEAMVQDAFPDSQDAFDAFSAKFDSTSANHLNSGAWGAEQPAEATETANGFESEAFDPFLSLGAPPPPAATPRRDSADEADDTFSVFIRPKEIGGSGPETVPALAPPPRPQALPESPRVNPFDSAALDQQRPEPLYEKPRRASGGSVRSRGSAAESPPTPLFDDDVSQPLEDFPRTKYLGPGWEMQLRQPVKKKITGQRFWKKVWVKVSCGSSGGAPVLQLFKAAGDAEPYQELPLQACYSVSEVGAQQFDQFGKIFTVKLQYVFYKERPGVRPGQVTKAERITNKLSQFAAYAIQGDYQGVKEFGSDLRKLGLPVEHAPQVSQLFKLGSLCYEDVVQFSCCIEEALFRLPAHRDRALHYKMEEVQITAVDELYVEQEAEGAVLKQIARVRLFFLSFLSGMPDIELGVNDLRRQGREVVGRHDIIPVVTEEWIRVEEPEFHACVQPEEFHNTQIIKFKPPDACYIELLRFRVRPPKNRELPLQLKASWCVNGNKVELRADVLVPGFASRKLGQVPCEDVAIRFPIPECWIYLFRVEKHHRYGSVKSAHRRTGKIKGIERFLGAVDTLSESLIEVTSGQAKYEHQHRALVWRMPRLPKEGQGAYTTHNLVCRMALTSFDQVPPELARTAHVSFTMPATQVSHMTVRSVSLQNHDRDDPPEKYVRYLARHEYIVGIERTSGQAAPAYSTAAAVERSAAPPAPAAPAAAAAAAPQPPSSDSDSD